MFAATTTVRGCLNNITTSVTNILNSVTQYLPLISPTIQLLVLGIGQCVIGIFNLDVSCAQQILAALGLAVGAILATLQGLLDNLASLLQADTSCITSALGLLIPALNTVGDILNNCA